MTTIFMMNLSELRLIGYLNFVRTWSVPRAPRGPYRGGPASSSPADIAWAYKDFDPYGSLSNRFTGEFQLETFA